MSKEFLPFNIYKNKHFFFISEEALYNPNVYLNFSYLQIIILVHTRALGVR